MTQLRADLLQRQAAGQELLRNQHIVASAAARQALAAGEVDARMLSTLAALADTAHLSVDVLAFGDSGPGASPGMPLRSAVLGTAGQQAGSLQYLQSVQGFLRAQQAPYRATTMTTERVSGQPVLYVEFAAPSPLELLPAGAPQ
jgi:hypothetical protein